MTVVNFKYSKLEAYFISSFTQLKWQIALIFKTDFTIKLAFKFRLHCCYTLLAGALSANCFRIERATHSSSSTLCAIQKSSKINCLTIITLLSLFVWVYVEIVAKEGLIFPFPTCSSIYSQNNVCFILFFDFTFYWQHQTNYFLDYFPSETRHVIYKKGMSGGVSLKTRTFFKQC